MIAPALYAAPFVGALGVNQFQAYAGIGVGATFWDVVIPPATSGKAVGAPTSLTLKPQLACTYAAEGGCAHCSPLTSGGFSEVVATLYQMDASTQIGGVLVNSGDTEGSPCPLFVQRTIDGLTVGTPALMKFTATVQGSTIAGWALDTPFGTERSVASTWAIDGLNTGYVTVTDADGNPVTGQSGVTYDGEPVLDPITTSTTTTTTTTFVPPTTLPGCSPDAYCGDGTYQPACGEACDCPPPAPGQTATICTADVALPSLARACALCIGCQVDESACATPTTSGPTTTLPEATTTTTVAIGGGTTTTTIPVGGGTTTTSLAIGGGATTTSTTLAGSPCAGRSGLDGVECVCRGGLIPSACAADRVPLTIGKLFARGCASIQHAEALGTEKKVKKIVHVTRAKFGSDLTRVAHAEKAKKHPLSSGCATALSGTLDDARARADRIVAGEP